MRSRGFTLLEAICCIIILGALGGSLFGRHSQLDRSANYNQFKAMVTAFNVGWTTVQTAKLVAAPASSGFSDADKLFCVFNNQAVLATFSSTTPSSVCTGLTYDGQSQATRNGYCQSIFTGILRLPPPIAGLASENFPAVPTGFTGTLTPALQALVPKSINYPGFYWVGEDEGTTPGSLNCTYFYLPAQSYGQIWIFQYNRSNGVVTNYELNMS